MADSNKNNIPSSGDDGSADGHPSRPQPELSVSRRVKIGSVLLLMLCGYFFMEDGPRSRAIDESDTRAATIDSEMQQFVDELEFVDSGNLRDEVDKLVQSNSQQPHSESIPARDSPLQLPAGLSDNSITTVAVDPPVNHRRRHSSQIAIRPKLRFTGRIEPLR